MARFILVISSLVVVAYAQPHDHVCACNEALNLCGRMCEPSCNNRRPHPITCPKIVCTKASEGCRCTNGHYRDQGTGKCVRPEQCPVPVTPTTPETTTSAITTTPQSCGKNEQLGNCGRICEKSCSNPNTNKCSFTSCAGLGCQCKEGYVRNERTDQCDLPSRCPKKCRRGEIVAACGRTCEGTCEKPYTPEICDRIRCANLDCRCDLASGWVRNKATGRCVKTRQCRNKKPVCPANSELKQCGRVCERTCRRPIEIFCNVDVSQCKRGCSCSKGFVRDEKEDKCVREISCPRQQHLEPEEKDKNTSGCSARNDKKF